MANPVAIAPGCSCHAGTQRAMPPSRRASRKRHEASQQHGKAHAPPMPVQHMGNARPSTIRPSVRPASSTRIHHHQRRGFPPERVDPL